jgi:hypothetical protein
MDAHQMLTAISATLAAGEEIEVRVTYARGRTLVVHHAVTARGYMPVRQSWNGYGNLRDTYRQRVLGARKAA